MKNISRYAAMAAMLVTAGVSCTKEETVEPQVQDGVRFVVNTAENTPVKSFIENNGDKTYTPKWSRGDKLAVFAGNAPELSGVLSNTNETGTIAKFEGSISGIATSGTFNSFAPASAYKSAAAGTAEIELASTSIPVRTLSTRPVTSWWLNLVITPSKMKPSQSMA